MNGLDLFSGIGGITLAIKKWVTPIAYCEIDKYCQSVLLQRMQEGNLPAAPIWDDVRTLPIEELPKIDIIYGGFPCQDISVAGRGKGLEGERSGLFFEIMRIVKAVKPIFVFLENVPAIRTRGLDRVLEEFTKERYDCRWTMLSAAEVGARHKRERWFLLAHSNSSQCGQSERGGIEAEKGKETSHGKNDNTLRVISGTSEVRKSSQDNVAYTKSLRADKLLGRIRKEPDTSSKGEISDTKRKRLHEGHEYQKRSTARYSWFEQNYWTVEPSVGRVAHGIPNRIHRIKALGNSVVPLQVETAFKRLMGFKHERL